jgi:uncharacterized repeat protein (TIGR03803 family)
MEQTQTDFVNRKRCSRILSGLEVSFRLPRGLCNCWFLVVILGLAYLGAPGNVGAQVTILYSFGGGKPSGGIAPNGGLALGGDGKFYGTTSKELGTTAEGYFSGTIFRFNPATSGFDTLKSFSPAKGESPESPLLVFKEGMVGIIDASPVQDGSIFNLDASGAVQTWHEFGSQKTNGANPSAPLVLGPHRDGYLFGVTNSGGANGSGTFYKLNRTTHKFTLIHSFSSSGPYQPTYLVLGRDGNFYGFASSTSGAVILMITPAGAVTTLYTFNRAGSPTGWTLMQASDGTFYGTNTVIGMYNAGTLFKMTGTPPSVTVTVLHDFGQGDDGASPSGPVVVGPNGNLYGETSSGGSSGLGDGTVHEIAPDGSAYTVLHNFGDGSIPNDGIYPRGGLTLGPDNNLYGTTFEGGAYDQVANGGGTLFKLSP